jgi:hypothetical protein
MILVREWIGIKKFIFRTYLMAKTIALKRFKKLFNQSFTLEKVNINLDIEFEIKSTYEKSQTFRF